MSGMRQEEDVHGWHQSTALSEASLSYCGVSRYLKGEWDHVSFSCLNFLGWKDVTGAQTHAIEV